MTISLTTHGKHEAAADKHDGTIIGISGDQLVTKSIATQERSYTLAPDATVLRDGNPFRVEDLRLGAAIRITTRKDNPNMIIGIECVPRV